MEDNVIHINPEDIEIIDASDYRDDVYDCYDIVPEVANPLLKKAKAGMNPKTLQYIIGHSDIAVTMNVYTYLGLDDAREELARLKEVRNVMKLKSVM